jgi:hypothetical protein
MNYIHSSVLDATTWQPFSLEGCSSSSKGVFKKRNRIQKRGEEEEDAIKANYSIHGNG